MYYIIPKKNRGWTVVSSPRMLIERQPECKCEKIKGQEAVCNCEMTEMIEVINPDVLTLTQEQFIGLTKAPQVYRVTKDGKAIERKSDRVFAQDLDFSKDIEINKIRQWFDWYDNQVIQYQRSMRLSEFFEPSDSAPNGRKYQTLIELDLEAKRLHLELRNLNGGKQ